MLEAGRERVRHKLASNLAPFLDPDENVVELVRVTTVPFVAPMLLASSIFGIVEYSSLRSTGQDSSFLAFALLYVAAFAFWLAVARQGVLVATDRRICFVRLSPLRGRLLGLGDSAPPESVAMTVSDRWKFAMLSSVRVVWSGRSPHRFFPLIGASDLEGLDRMAAIAGRPPKRPV